MQDENVVPPIVKFLSAFVQNVINNNEQTVYLCVVDYSTIHYLFYHVECLGLECKQFFCYNTDPVHWNALECNKIKKKYPNRKIILVIVSYYVSIHGELLYRNDNFELYTPV